MLQMTGSLYSVQEAAFKMGLSEQYLRALLANGEVRGRKLGRDWVILSLDYQRKRRPKTKKGEAEGKEGRDEGEGLWTEGSL
jgi:excisionase family DNA binding protein